MSDYYSTLGVSNSASADEIKSAYKRKVVEWHPDRNKSKEAPEMIKKINKAYEVLSDPQKKSMYDQLGHDNYEKRGPTSASSGQGWPGGAYQYSTGGPGGFNVEFDFGGAGVEDIFETFFGGARGYGGGRARPRRGVYEMTLTFDEAVRGVTKQTVISGASKDIKIPAGVDNGMRIRFSDFDVVVHVKPHPHFRREGQDLYYQMDVPFTTAALGGVVRVPLIEGHIDLKVRPGTQSGSVVRLTGKGIPYPNRNQWGDFYVTYRVHVPQRMNAKAKKLLEDLRKEIG